MMDKETDSTSSELVLPRDQSPNHREFSIYGKPDDFDLNDCKHSSSLSAGGDGASSSSSSNNNNNNGHSFTQRLIDRGVAVPSSFSNWEKVRLSEDSFSPGSFDIDSHYGMSPFITPSFSTATTDIDSSLYKSLRHRYEKEKFGSSSSTRLSDTARLSAADDDDQDSASPASAATAAGATAIQGQRKKHRAEDSDIELSDEEDSTTSLEKQLQLPLSQRSLRSRSPLSYPPTTPSASSTANRPKADGIFDLMKPQNYADMYEEAPRFSPSVERIKQMLTTAPAAAAAATATPPQTTPSPPPPPQSLSKPTKPLPDPPRQHLLHTPVFQVVNANTVKDRYLFLFNDLLLICKPIMDENIIVSSSSKRNNNSNSSGNSSNGNGNSSNGRSSGQERNRYRFRPNEHSLFQVKNIVQLGQLTLYISKEDIYNATHAGPTTVEIGPDGRPILPPARKIHPIMASALRKFETNANLGIEYLIDKGVLTKDPLSIANFLFKTPDLNRRQLGYYLSDLNNSDVYDAFLESFRLVGLRLDEALRILLTTFRLPSNWEALEYLIERFAKKWHDANQNVIKFHEDMVVKVVVAMLFLNAEFWYDATSERDVFWYARELKERQDRQAKRKMSMLDYHHLHQQQQQRTNAMQKPSTSTSAAALSTSSSRPRQSVAVEPLHYITSLRARGNSQPSLNDFLERWDYYDQYRLVPREFMEEMYKSIGEERLETGWDNKTGRRIQSTSTSSRQQQPEQEEQQQQENGGGVERPKAVSPSVQQGSQDVVITVTPHRLPTRLTKGLKSNPITISIPAPDKGLQIKLRGQDLVFEPNVLDFSSSCIQAFTITGNTLGRTSLMFIKTGENAGNYVSPTLPRTKSVVVERPFMRYTFQIGFKHVDHEKDKKKMLMEAAAMVADEEEEEVVEQQERKKQDKLAKKPRNAATTTTATRRNRGEKEHNGGDDDDEAEERPVMVNRKYTFSVETEEERIQWLEALKKLSGHVNQDRNEKSIVQMHAMSSEARVALQVLKEVLLADEVKKGTARTSSSKNATASANSSTVAAAVAANNPSSEYQDKHGRAMRLLLPKKKEDERNAIVAAATASATATATATTTSTTANVVTKRGHEIIKLVVQNSMVPLVLGFLKSQIP
ncbi:hypothetical protein [Parasitella parasitica]|uniref:SEC7 domain-containing protein n=1 Tax=Parasitella parasitica TaxID=35722 RepID=A0A0B7MM37_9FUNG|nr:hypothetical protein [Parasitella parasitica]